MSLHSTNENATRQWGALFPGQGSQFVGMGEFLLKEFAPARHCFEEAGDTLGYDLAKLCLKGPETQLNLTENTQPALVTLSIATLRVVQKLTGIQFQGAAGHSVGEYGALVGAGVISFSKAVELVRLRGKLMQESVPQGQGAMLAVTGLRSEEVEKLCQWAREERRLPFLEPANYNSPSQTVISGQKELISWVQENFTPDKIEIEKKKVRLIPLKVSAPFHCSMMKKAETEMAPVLSETNFKKPDFGIAQNFSGSFETDPEVLKKNLIAQISGPVRWVDCTKSLIAQKITCAGEFGPGKVLSGLTKKIDPNALSVFNFNNSEDLENFKKQWHC